MSNPGEIAPLARLARPHVALVTTVAPAHLAAFDDLAGIAREKASIAEGLEPGGLAILPADLPPELRAALENAVATDRIWFGDAPEAEARVLSVTETEAGAVVRALVPQGEALVRVGVPGRHLVRNALGALAASAAAGADLARSAAGLGRWSPVGGRGLREAVALDPDDPAQSIILIDDAFNANPASMAAALDALTAAAPRPGGRRVAVLGDMLELGPSETVLHADLARHPALDAIDEVHCAGPRIRAAFDTLPPGKRGTWTGTAEEMAATIHTLLRPGDVVLVKGSKGARTALVVDAIRELGHRHRRQA